MTVKPVLRQIAPLPGSLDGFVRIVPENPFRCVNILFYFQDNAIIKYIKVGPDDQLISAIPASLMAAPVELKVIEEWFKAGLLPDMLREHFVWPIQLSIATPLQPIEVGFEGQIDLVLFYGVEHIKDSPKTGGILDIRGLPYD
jgi:hypothetical protein